MCKPSQWDPLEKKRELMTAVALSFGFCLPWPEAVIVYKVFACPLNMVEHLLVLHAIMFCVPGI